MGRKKPDKPQSGQIKYGDPREAYLSTKNEMLVVENTNLNMSVLFDNSISEKAVIAEDQKGFYVTGKSYVGALTMDPYRSCNNVRITVNVEKTETGFDITVPARNMLFSISC
jgi:hypothetical protein